MSSAAPARRTSMTTTRTTTFTGISTVAIPVADQDRTKELFESLGLEVRVDVMVQPGFRWLELGVPETPTTLAIIAAGDDLPSGVDTGIRLVTADARAAHATLVERGLEVGELLDWDTAPLMFEFRDHDGNRLYVAERS